MRTTPISLRWMVPVLVAALLATGMFTGQRPARAGDIHAVIGKLLKERQLLHKFGGTFHLEQPVVTLHVPVKVIGMPPPWRDADLMVVATSVFFDSNHKVVGVAKGCVTYPEAFKTGSCLKDVILRCSKLRGMVTENYSLAVAVIARGEGQAMWLGQATKENAGQFSVTSYTPATTVIFNLNDPVFAGIEDLCGQ